jgi:hypothetical protein
MKKIIFLCTSIQFICHFYLYAQENNEGKNQLNKSQDSTQISRKKSVPAVISSESYDSQKLRTDNNNKFSNDSIQNLSLFFDSKRMNWRIQTKNYEYLTVKLVGIIGDTLIISTQGDKKKIPVGSIKQIRCLQCDSAYKPLYILGGIILGASTGVITAIIYNWIYPHDVDSHFLDITLIGCITGIYYGFKEAGSIHDYIYNFSNKTNVKQRVNIIRIEIFGMLPIN